MEYEELTGKWQLEDDRNKQSLLYSVPQVYGEHLDTIGHKYGPNSAELRQALIDVDGLLNELLDQLLDSQLDEKVHYKIFLQTLRSDSIMWVCNEKL